MPYTIEAATLPAQPVASVRRTTGLDRIGADLAESFGVLHAAVTAAGVPIVGAPLVRYHDLIDEDTDGDIEVCVPIPGTDVDLDGVEVATLPVAGTARTIHRGPYDELRPAYHALFAWIHDNGREPAGPPQETYLNDPTEVSEDEQLTQVDVPLA